MDTAVVGTVSGTSIRLLVLKLYFNSITTYNNSVEYDSSNQ